LFLIFVKKQSQELTKVNPDRNIFSINVELTSTFLLYRGLVHHHHRILNLIKLYINNIIFNCTLKTFFWLQKYLCEFLHCILWAINADKPQMKISNFDEQKHAYLIHTWSDKAFKGIAILCLEGHLKLRLHSVSALKLTTTK